MSEREPRRLARIGQFYIQEAILTILEDAPGGLLLGEIRKKLALPHQGYSATVTAQLKELRTQGRVYQPAGTGSQWTLTEKEKHRRQG